MQAQIAPKQGAARGTWMGILLAGGFLTAGVPELAVAAPWGPGGVLAEQFLEFNIQSNL